MMNPEHDALTSQGAKPKNFWINALGEYGHNWSDGSETYGGSINVTQVAKDNGLKHTEEPTERMLKMAFDQDLYREIIDPREVALYRAWEHLQPLSDARFRFNGALSFDPTVLLPGVLWMTTEYVLDDQGAQTLSAFADSFRAEVEPMWADHEDPTRTQYAVNFDVFGRSFGEVASLQFQWLTQTEEHLGETLVGVL